jgi:formyl-CoA transferase
MSAGSNGVEILNDAGVPCGPINAIDKVFAEPQVQHVGIAQRPANGDAVTLVGQAIHMSRTPSQVQSAPHRHGEDTDSILESYGLSTDDIEALRAKDVIA